MHAAAQQSQVARTADYKSLLIGIAQWAEATIGASQPAGQIIAKLCLAICPQKQSKRQIQGVVAQRAITPEHGPNTLAGPGDPAIP
jgi:hypothetical protein